MPSELRHLLFRPPEVELAVIEYYRRLGHSLPPGVVLSSAAEKAASGAIRFKMTIGPDGSGGHHDTDRQDLVVEGAKLAAALILFCRNHRIPLPAQSEKSLQLFGDQVCLLSTLQPKKGEVAAA